LPLYNHILWLPFNRQLVWSMSQKSFPWTRRRAILWFVGLFRKERIYINTPLLRNEYSSRNGHTPMPRVFYNITMGNGTQQSHIASPSLSLWVAILGLFWTLDSSLQNAEKSPLSTNGRLRTNNCHCLSPIKHISILRAMGAGSSQDVYPASMNYFDTVSTDLTRTYLFFNQFCHLHFSRSGCRTKSEKMFYLFLFFRHDFIDTVCKTLRVHSLFYRLPRGGYRTCCFTWSPSTVLRGTYAFHFVQRYCDNVVCISSIWTTDTQFSASQTLCSLDIVRRRLRVGGAQSILRVISELLLFFFMNIFFFSLRVFRFHRILEWLIPRLECL